MQSTPSRALGFTLIELLIVVAIVAVAGSVIGPYSIEMLNRHQYKQEIAEARRTLRDIAEVSFLSGYDLSIELKENQLFVFKEGRELPKLTTVYEQLKFKEQRYSLRSSGFLSPLTIELDNNDRFKVEFQRNVQKTDAQ